MANRYSEFHRMSIAKEEYSEYVVNDKFSCYDLDGNKLHIGTVTKIYADKQSGLRAIVVKNK